MSIAWSWNEMSLAWIGLVLYAMSAKQFARNSWGRLTKDCNLTQVENSKVFCMETELSVGRGGGTVTKPWEGYSHSSMAQSHLLQLPRGGGLGRFDLIHPEQQCSGSVTSSTWQGRDATKLQHCCLSLNTWDWVQFFHFFNICCLSICYLILGPKQQCERLLC